MSACGVGRVIKLRRLSLSSIYIYLHEETCSTMTKDSDKREMLGHLVYPGKQPFVLGVPAASQGSSLSRAFQPSRNSVDTRLLVCNDDKGLEALRKKPQSPATRESRAQRAS
ncbi:hypothetical protein ACU8KH_03290 [Lachancea thermotolerans]